MRAVVVGKSTGGCSNIKKEEMETLSGEAFYVLVYK